MVGQIAILPHALYLEWPSKEIDLEATAIYGRGREGMWDTTANGLDVGQRPPQQQFRHLLQRDPLVIGAMAGNLVVAPC